MTSTSIAGSTGASPVVSRNSASATRHCVARPDGDNGGNGTQRSGNAGRSPHHNERNARAVEALSEPSLLDDDRPDESCKEKIMAKLNGECIAGCGKDDDTYKCPNLKGDREAQKKIFASIGSHWKSFPVWAITVEDESDEVDLIDLNDLNDQEGSDTDQEFP